MTETNSPVTVAIEAVQVAIERCAAHAGDAIPSSAMAALRDAHAALEKAIAPSDDTSQVDAIAKIIDPDVWAFRDRALAPYREGRGSIGDENWIYQITYKAGMRSVDEVDTWLREGEPEETSPIYSRHVAFQISLLKAKQILAAKPTIEGPFPISWETEVTPWDRAAYADFVSSGSRHESFGNMRAAVEAGEHDSMPMLRLAAFVRAQMLEASAGTFLKPGARLALGQIRYFLRSVQNGDDQAANAHTFIRILDGLRDDVVLAPAQEQSDEAILVSLIYDDGEHEPHEASREAICLSLADAHAFVAARFPEARRVGDDELAGYDLVVNGKDLDMTVVLWRVPLWDPALATHNSGPQPSESLLVNAGPVTTLLERWERIGEEKGIMAFTGNSHKLFANELRAALTHVTRAGRTPDLIAALAELEAANDALCGLRTREQYLSLIDSSQQDALLRLDEARRRARELIKQGPVYA